MKKLSRRVLNHPAKVSLVLLVFAVTLVACSGRTTLGTRSLSEIGTGVTSLELVVEDVDVLEHIEAPGANWFT